MHINVLAGRRREVVGTLLPKVGLLTNLGKILRITPKGTLVVNKDNKESRISDLSRVSVRLTEARKAGFPSADGCTTTRQNTGVFA